MLFTKPEELYLKAKKLHDEESWKGSVRLWQKYKRRVSGPAAPEVYRYLYVGYSQLGQKEKAEESLIEGVKTHGDDQQTLYLYAQLLSSKGQDQESLMTYKKIIGLGGGIAEEKVYARAVKASITLRDDQSLDLVKEGLRQHPKNVNMQIDYLRMLRDSGSLKELLHYAEKHSAQSGIAATIVLDAIIDLGTKKDVSSLLSVIASHFDEDTSVQGRLAQIYESRSMWKEALLHWNKFIKAVESSSSIRENLYLYQQARAAKSILGRILDISEYKSSIDEYTAKKKNPRIAIVTAYNKGYDTVKPHSLLSHDIEYLVYTDEASKMPKFFNRRDLIIQDNDPARSIRQIKMQPHKMLQEYDYVVWLDTSIMIIGDVLQDIELFKRSGLAIASTPHSERKTVYEEFDACIEQGKGNIEELQRQRRQYENENIVGDQLAENGYLLFNMKHPDLAGFLDEWWGQLNTYSSRDQLGFAYAAEKTNTNWYKLSEDEFGIRNKANLVVLDHGKGTDALQALQKMLIT